MLVSDTARKVSENASTSAPWRPCTTNMTIHHSDTSTLNTPIFSAVMAARRQVMVRAHAAWTSQSTGAGATSARAVAFTAPTVSTTSAASAASRHRVRVVARMVRPTIQPTPAHGSSITDVRDTYGSTYGDTAYTTPATVAGIAARPRWRAAHRTPSPPRNSSVPSHSRCATQSGTPSRSNTQNHGPDGHR